MGREGIVQLLKDIHGPNIPLEHRKEWVNSPCPLAPWTHDSGKDSHPSFGVKIEDGAESRCYCFTCKTSGSILRLLQLIAKYSEDDSLLQEYESVLVNEEFAGGVFPEWKGSRPGAVKPSNRLVPLGDEYEDLYDPLEEPYRGVTVETAQSIGMGMGEDSRGDNRVVFPVRGLGGELYGYTGRATDPKAVPRVRDFHGLRKEDLLLGLHTLPGDPPFIVLVEGLFAYAKTFQAGFPTVAAMHANLTDNQSKWLLKIGKPVVIFFDHDEAGKSGTVIAARKLVNHVPVRRVVYPRNTPHATDPDDLSPKKIGSLIDKARLVTWVPSRRK